MTRSLRFRERLPPPVRACLSVLANRLIPYRKQALLLDVEAGTLRSALAEREADLLRLGEDNRTLQSTLAEREADLLRVGEDNRTLQSTLAEREADLQRLGEENRALAAANADQQRRLLQLDEENRALAAVNTDQQRRLLQLSDQNCQLKAAQFAKEKINSELTAIAQAHEKRIAELETHNAALTSAAIERENKLREKAELDYQALMVHQQVLAELSDAEPEFRELYDQYKAYTMTSIERLYNLYKCVEYIAKAGIPGDLVECGVWRGGSCMMMAATLLRMGRGERRIIMFDTFEGHPAPDPDRDVDLWGNRAFEQWRQETRDGSVKGWGYASLEEVRDNLRSTGYPEAQLQFVKGMVEETAIGNSTGQLALLRLDTDWYSSTRAALVHLYPRLAAGGVLILDDYGHYRGQREAVDEYFDSIGDHLMFQRIDYSCRVAVKPLPRSAGAPE